MQLCVIKSEGYSLTIMFISCNSEKKSKARCKLAKTKKSEL